MKRDLLSITDGSNPISTDVVALFIVQLVLIIVIARFLGYLFRYIKQPQVVAEVITGIILGPSVLGNIPNFSENIFPTSSLNVIDVFANIGLIFFMFLIGVELDPSLLRTNAKKSTIIALSSMAAPFGLGAVLSILLYDMFADSSVKFSSFLLFVGVAMSITAFPVLARILTEQRMTHHKVGLIALSSAAVNDVVAWVLLALVVSIAKASSPLSTLWTVLLMVAFFAVMWFGVRALLEKLNVASDKAGESRRHQLVVAVMLITLVSSWFTDVIGIDAIFGGFVTGVICPKSNGFAVYLTERIEDIIVILLLPLYFTYSGLRTNLADLSDGTSWGICFLVITLACAGKILGSAGASLFVGNGWRESFTVGILMNTKGLVELIVLNLGLDAGVLTQELFAIFVMMALVTTMLTTPLLHLIWIRHQRRKSAPHIHDSFNVMMCISNEASGLAMMSVAATLSIHKRRKFSVKAVHVREVTESPSSYFFSQSAPLPHFLEIVQERARALGCPVKVKQIFAQNVAEDLDYYCRSKSFDLILIAWNEQLLEIGGSKIKQVLAHTHSTVAILIDKGLHKTVSITRVLAVYTGEPHQREALKIARRMCRKESTEVTILSSVSATEVGIAENEPLNFVLSDKPLAEGIAESRRGYDLLVVGIAREWSSHESTILQTSELLSRTPASVLLVHPKVAGARKRPRRKPASPDSQSKARLYFGGEHTMVEMSKLSEEDVDPQLIALDPAAAADAPNGGGPDDASSSSDADDDDISPVMGQPDVRKDELLLVGDIDKLSLDGARYSPPRPSAASGSGSGGGGGAGGGLRSTPLPASSENSFYRLLEPAGRERVASFDNLQELHAAQELRSTQDSIRASQMRDTARVVSYESLHDLHAAQDRARELRMSHDNLSSLRDAITSAAQESSSSSSSNNNNEARNLVAATAVDALRAGAGASGDQRVLVRRSSSHHSFRPLDPADAGVIDNLRSTETVPRAAHDSRLPVTAVSARGSLEGLASGDVAHGHGTGLHHPAVPAAAAPPPAAAGGGGHNDDLAPIPAVSTPRSYINAEGPPASSSSLSSSSSLPLEFRQSANPNLHARAAAHHHPDLQHDD